MLTQIDYDNLQAIDQLPGGFYLETERPKFLNHPHEEYLLDARCFEQKQCYLPEKNRNTRMA